MTAIGFALLIIGWITNRIFGSPNPFVTTWGEEVANLLFLLGIILSAIGITLWLWKVMP